MLKNKRNTLIIVTIIVILLGMQLIPLDRTNPPVTARINWDSEQTKEIFYKSCADCHSNETKWPWYSYVAPISYFVIYDVIEGREHFNISVDQKDERDEAVRMVRMDIMPMSIYTAIHKNAKLSPEEKTKLILGLKSVFGEDNSKEKDINKYNEE
jgi:hypothetical protein